MHDIQVCKAKVTKDGTSGSIWWDGQNGRGGIALILKHGIKTRKDGICPNNSCAMTVDGAKI